MSGRPLRVLIVAGADTAAAAESLRAELQARGHEVRTGPAPEEAAPGAEGEGAGPTPWATAAVRLGLSLADLEREYIQAVLASHGGHRGRTARTLGIDPKTLYNKLGTERPRKAKA